MSSAQEKNKLWGTQLRSDSGSFLRWARGIRGFKSTDGSLRQEFERIGIGDAGVQVLVDHYSQALEQGLSDRRNVGDYEEALVILSRDYPELFESGGD